MNQRLRSKKTKVVGDDRPVMGGIVAIQHCLKYAFEVTGVDNFIGTQVSCSCWRYHKCYRERPVDLTAGEKPAAKLETGAEGLLRGSRDSLVDHNIQDGNTIWVVSNLRRTNVEWRLSLRIEDMYC